MKRVRILQKKHEMQEANANKIVVPAAGMARASSAKGLRRDPSASGGLHGFSATQQQSLQVFRD